MLKITSWFFTDNFIDLIIALSNFETSSFSILKSILVINLFDTFEWSDSNSSVSEFNIKSKLFAFIVSFAPLLVLILKDPTTIVITY